MNFKRFSLSSLLALAILLFQLPLAHAQLDTNLSYTNGGPNIFFPTNTPQLYDSPAFSLAKILNSLSSSPQLFTPTITVSTSGAYSSNQCKGGLITLTNAAARNRTPYIDGLLIQDGSAQMANDSFVFFSAQPTNGTYADKSNVVYNGDQTNIIQRVNIWNYTNTWKWDVDGTYAMLSIPYMGVDIPVATTQTNIWMIIISKGTPAYSRATDYSVTLKIQK